MTARPAPAPFTWRRAPLSMLLLALMLLWMLSPVIWLYAIGQIGPDSNVAQTPEQSRALRVADWTTFSYALIAPMVVVSVSWWTRRRVVLTLTLSALALGALAVIALLLMT
ncbi:hypothetical protein AB0J72_51445 [Dactylosporangium sp. NPDC049742]|uniref:hypothetical protein n=1 Tax=Dactylosporangium sp. NPDC049742 TaxID=3154737 RepID=UPI003424988B